LNPKILGIGLVIVIIGLASWRLIAGHVDRTKPDAVAGAFLKELKANRVAKAAQYWVPEGADAWRDAALARIDSMQSGTFARFFEDLPASGATFTSSRGPKAPANEQTLTAGGTSVDVRQIGGKWYVCKGPV
jgi:hypothetical protein